MESLSDNQANHSRNLPGKRCVKSRQEKRSRMPIWRRKQDQPMLFALPGTVWLEDLGIAQEDALRALAA